MDENDFISHKKESDESSVWFHFLVNKNGSQAKCNCCPKIIQCKRKSTSGLHTHLRTKHNINILKKILNLEGNIDDKCRAKETPLSPGSTSHITNFFKSK